MQFIYSSFLGTYINHINTSLMKKDLINRYIDNDLVATVSNNDISGNAIWNSCELCAQNYSQNNKNPPCIFGTQIHLMVFNGSLEDITGNVSRMASSSCYC